MAKRKTKAEKEVEEIAQQTLDGRWGTGRERDIRLREAGHNATEIQTVRARLRAEQANPQESEEDSD